MGLPFLFLDFAALRALVASESLLTVSVGVFFELVDYR